LIDVMIADHQELFRIGMADILAVAGDSHRLSKEITRWTRGIYSDGVFFLPLRNVTSSAE
jgi:hypothetical protein